MGRKRTKLNLTLQDRAEIDYRRKITGDQRQKERLSFLILASTGDSTLDELARAADRSRSTIQNWMDKFRKGGLCELLRRESAPGMKSPLTRIGVRSKLVQGLKCQRWATAQQIVDWLEHEHGIHLSRKSVYYWIRKYGVPSK